MARNLKILMLAAMAVAALGALSAVGAQAAQFHCTPLAGQEGCDLKAESDGTGKTAHHVFEISNSASPKESTTITCSTISGTGRLLKTSEFITITAVSYLGCTWNGSTAEVKMNGCQYEFGANGGKVKVVGCKGAEIELIIPTCTAKIGEQSLSGITYHNIGTTPNRTVTLEANVTTAVTSLAGSNCGIKLTGPYAGHYTTGNTIIQAREESGTGERDGWWE